MNGSLHCLSVLVLLAPVWTSVGANLAAAEVIDESVVALPCRGRGTVHIASLEAGSATVTVYNPRGGVKDTHEGLNYSVDGATSVSLSLSRNFLGLCVVRATTPIVASVVNSNKGGSKTPIGLPASTDGGSDFLMNILANEDQTVTSKALFTNPADGRLGVDSFCNDPANNSASITHWDVNTFGNTLMDPYLDADLSFLGLDLTCQQVYQNAGAGLGSQPPGSYAVVKFNASGDEVFAPGARLAEVLGGTQYIPLVHGGTPGSSRTSVTLRNIGPGSANGKITAYDSRGKRAGRKTVRIAEGHSTTIDSVTDELGVGGIDVTGLEIAFAAPVSTNGNILFVGEVDLPFGKVFGAHLPTYTSKTVFTELAGIPGIASQAGDQVRIGLANFERKKARVRVRVMGADGTTQLNRKIKVRKRGSGSVDLPASLAGQVLHVLIEVLRGSIVPYATEVRASGEVNIHAAQPFTPIQ